MSTINDLERDFLLQQLGVSGVGETIDDLRQKFYAGVIDGSVSVGVSKSQVEVYNNVGVSLASSTSFITNPPVAFESEITDTDGYHDLAVNNSRLTVPAGKGGLFTVVALVTFDFNATGLRKLGIYKNNSLIWQRTDAASASGSTTVNEEFTLSLADGDYVEVRVAQNSGAALNLLASADQCYFKAYKLR